MEIFFLSRHTFLKEVYTCHVSPVRAEPSAEPALLTWLAPADRARVRSSEWITRANPRVYRVGAAFGRERPIRASTPCDGELGDRAKHAKIGYASADWAPNTLLGGTGA